VIIFKDKNILAVDKPAGIVIHPDDKNKEGTLIQKILKEYPEIENVGEDPKRPGIVHRLDKDTSGVLIIARNQKTFDFLKKSFQKRKIKKTYIALVKDILKNNHGKITTPIGRSKSTPVQRLASEKARGKIREAETDYKVMKKFENHTLLKVYPKTGRTHQIRVHLKSIGHPVVCDKLYSKKPDCPLGLKRHFLHAKSIELKLPDESKIRLEADLPKDLQTVLKSLK
jgi:23S rRNA pseudouridine1911/1915/1917 synthase